MRVSKLMATVAAVPLLLSTLGSPALADDISNDLDGDIDAVAEVMALQVGGSAGTTKIYLQPRNGDGNPGCNLPGSATLELGIGSSDTTVATVSPSSVTFTSCGDFKALTVTPVAEGTATVSASLTRTTGTSGSFNLAPATFTVNVTPAATNTPPSVKVTGVEAGATYDKGAVPDAVCEVTDAEDGDRAFPATLGAITGEHAAGGIGSQTASCSYTDAGKLTAAESVTYSIGDPTVPEISYTLEPGSPDGLEGWYRGDVTLTWHVTEPDSPGSLRKTGCTDQVITADQLATEYTCSAGSAGGTTGTVSVSVKRDGTAPTVEYGGLVSGTEGNEGWYTSDVTVGFTGTDGHSGLAEESQQATSRGEGHAVTVGSPAFTDRAGNTRDAGYVSSPAFKIDKTGPEVTYDGVENGTPGANGWYISDVVQRFKAVDTLSGPTEELGTVTLDTEGEGLTAESPAFSDVAGNTTAAGAASSPGVKIDKTAPSVPVISGAPSDGSSFVWGTTPDLTAGCTAEDAVSGLQGCEVVRTGPADPKAVGTHTLTATATNGAGLSSTATTTYTVTAWNTYGFYAPVDMTAKGATSKVWNVVKAGSTVPLKFEVYAGDTELTSIDAVKDYRWKAITCTTGEYEAVADTLLSTGGTSLRYDSVAGQFIQNWKVPTGGGKCYDATVTTQDGSTITAYFKTK
ncbi:MAG TPA: PxKF domain-containing protein [Nocardioidaceae bacterium]|nr:PxKF domain-containing protein [Nocardioidaceae bacterium]